MRNSVFDEWEQRLARALEGGETGRWAELDEHIRAAVRWGPAVHGLTWLPGGTGGRRPTTPELAFALCGPDGRLREAALAYAADAPALLPLVAIRCADWAGPVRERARAVLRAELPRLTPEALGPVAAVALRAAQRAHGDAARELLFQVLRAGPAAGVETLLASRDRAVRRLAHRIAVERGLLSPTRLATIAARDADVVVQDLCANAVLATATPDPAVLGLLLAARPGRIRAAGVTGLRRAGRADEAEPFLYDRSALARACARYVLRQAGTEPLPLYRAACAAGDRTPHHAPLGLAECGDRAADVPTLWSLTGHALPQVRASAVAGLRLMDAVRPGRLAPLLDDGSPRVVRETRKALSPWA
ncbi:hypothetical protein AB0M38_28045 [Streptomyces sp. NPDC051742]|uniref:hypothetical protein n=1 Tax=unclassified Streptomyces TaxID=2593676 RepID=UPI00343928C3